MADYVLTLGSLAALAAAALLIWRWKAGAPRSVGRAIGRIALCVTVALAVVGVIIYSVMNSRSFQLAGALADRVQTDKKVVALTFDDGPTPGYTEQVLRTLKAHKACATFYLTGRERAENPTQLREIIAAGDELGNHTYSHRALCFVSGATVAAEIERTDAVFRSAGYHGPITFRPPGCKRLLTATLYLARHHRTTVTWDLEPDSVAGDSDAIVKYVVDGVRPGSIVEMHVMYASREPTRKALPRILERLSAEGYRFVTVSQLIALH